MFDRLGKDAVGRPARGSRGRSKAGDRLRVEPLEGRSLLAASLAPIPSVTVEAGTGYQVPLNGAFNGNADNQTYTVTTDSPVGGVTAAVSPGQFWTVGVSHASSGTGDPAFSGTMTFQLFDNLTPSATSHIESLITGTAPFASLTSTPTETGKPSGQTAVYPNGSTSPGVDYYTGAGDTFHRVANLTPAQTPNDLIVQGGSINGDGTGQVFATPYANEILPQLEFNGSGQLALANSNSSPTSATNDSQFFITTGLNIGLNVANQANGGYTIFGQLVSGANILSDLSHVAVGGSDGTTPTSPITITSSALTTTNPDAVLNINATGATAGTQTNVTVTATDTVDHTQTTQTFPVLTIPASTFTPSTTTPPSLNSATSPVTTPANTPATFQLSATNPSGGSLSYTVQGGLTNGAFTAVQNGTATVSSTGLVTVTPNPGYTGQINLVVGVEDNTDRTGQGLTSPTNYSLQNVTVNVGSFTTPPTINPVSSPIAATYGQTVTIPLSATNPSGGQLSYVVEGGLTDGAFTPVVNANATVNTATGMVTVTPAANTAGPIDLLVGVRDQTDRSGTGNLDNPSNFSTEMIVVNYASPTAPTINPVTTPISAAFGATVPIQLSATNPSGGQLSYIVEGGINTTTGAFTPITNATATVNANGLVTLVPNAGTAGPVNLLVGVRDQINRGGSATTINSPSNYSTESIVVNYASPTPPTINPVTTPIAASVSQTVQVQLSATNPEGAQLSYIVEGGLTSGAFTAVQNATAAVDGNGLLSVIPNAGYTGPIDLLVGVRDQTDRSGTGNINAPTNFSTENIVINVGPQTSTGAVRFIQDSSTAATGILVVTPLPQTTKNASNTIDVTTNSAGDAEVIVNGVIDLNQPALNDVTSIVVYGSTASDRITVDPALTVPVTLSGGTGGKDVLTAGGGQTFEQGWHSTSTVEKQGEGTNSLFGRAGHVTFVKGSGTNTVTFAGTPPTRRGNSRIRRIPPLPSGTFYTFSGTKLVPTKSPYPKTTVTFTNGNGVATTTTGSPTNSNGSGTSSGSTSGGPSQDVVAAAKVTTASVKATKVAKTPAKDAAAKK